MNNYYCPCGTLKAYADCCKVAHLGIKPVTNAETLMRSRYNAFVKADINYLLLSWSSKTKNTSKRLRKELLDWTTSVNWVKLEILNTSQGTINDSTGTIAFKAFYFENGQLECISENSFFKKENDHWVYVKAI